MQTGRNVLYSSILRLRILRNKVGLLRWWSISIGPSRINLDWKPQSSVNFLFPTQSLSTPCKVVQSKLQFPPALKSFNHNLVQLIVKPVSWFCQSQQFSQFSFPHSTLVNNFLNFLFPTQSLSKPANWLQLIPESVSQPLQGYHENLQSFVSLFPINIFKNDR